MAPGSDVIDVTAVFVIGVDEHGIGDWGLGLGSGMRIDLFSLAEKPTGS